MIGGKLTLRGEYDGMSPESTFSGRARIVDFRVIKAPILAKLLNVASITGIVDELLGGVGIGFAKLDAPFESKDDVHNGKRCICFRSFIRYDGNWDYRYKRGNLDLKVPLYQLT